MSLKNIIYLCFIVFFLFVFKYFTISANGNFFDGKIILNFDVSNRYIVYEYEEVVNNTKIHGLALENIETGIIERILNNQSNLINDSVYFPSISSDGDYFVYTSRSNNITSDDISLCYNIEFSEYSNCSNIYLYDVKNKKSILITSNDVFNGDSYIAKISGDGKSVVFESVSSNYLKRKYDCSYINGISNCINIFKYDILTKNISLVSTSGNNNGGNSNSINPSISYDGRYVVFQSNSSNFIKGFDMYPFCYNYLNNKEEVCSNLYIVDTFNSSLRLITKNDNGLFDGDSGNSIISGNGEYVAYESYANNIENYSNGKRQIILYSVKNQTNKIISSNNGKLNNRDNYLDFISDDGKYIIYRTNSSNLSYNTNLNMFVYSSNSNKTSIIVEHSNDVVFTDYYDGEIYYYDNFNFNKTEIDVFPPEIDVSDEVYVLIGTDFNIKDKIKISDNLSSNEKINVYIKDFSFLEIVGEHDILVSATDEFNNLSQNTIKFIVIEKDYEGPLFSDVDEIKILKGSLSLNLSNYIFANDKVDGNTRIFIVDDGDLDLETTGKYCLKLMSKDESNNITYKDVYVVVYENYDLKFYYEIIVILGVIMVIIFSIIKVKLLIEV